MTCNEVEAEVIKNAEQIKQLFTEITDLQHAVSGNLRLMYKMADILKAAVDKMNGDN